jgi:hypothetical protein
MIKSVCIAALVWASLGLGYFLFGKAVWGYILNALVVGVTFSCTVGIIYGIREALKGWK